MKGNTEMKRILFANHAQFEGRRTNLGDWAIFEQMEETLLPEIKKGNIEIIVPSADVDYTNSHYHVKAFKRGGIGGIFRTLKWIVKSDIVLIGGGEIVQDRSSLVYIPYQLIRPFIAKLFGKKLFAYAIGVGEKEEISFLGKWQSKLVLNMFDIITVRDEKSYTVLREYLKVKRPEIYVTADPALNLKCRKVDEPGMESPYFVISVRSVYHRNGNLLPYAVRKKLKLVPKKYYEEINKFKNDVVEMVENLIEKYDFNAKFLNTYTGPKMSASDDKFTADVMRRITKKYQSKISVINTENTPAEIKYVLGKAQFIITVPLHPLILGASENVPVFSLAYASKNKSFMKQIGRSENIYSVEQIGQCLDVEKILCDIQNVMDNNKSYKNNLLKEVNYNKEKERKNFEKLMALCKLY